MGEEAAIEAVDEPVTVSSLAEDLRALGVEAGDTLLVHASLGALGWVCGGAPAVVDALREVLTDEGTLVMPSHSPGNRDPSNMSDPPVPESWYETVREEMSPYRPEMTPTRGMGAIPECFRSYPGVRRSAHPQHSFAAWGADADFVVEDHAVDRSLGESSPLARVYDLDGDVLFLGTTHATNTSFHLAEYRADLDLPTTRCGSAVLVDGERQWVWWEDLDVSDADFPEAGAAFEAANGSEYEEGAVGATTAKRFDQPALVDFAVDWLEANRERRR